MVFLMPSILRRLRVISPPQGHSPGMVRMPTKPLTRNAKPDSNSSHESLNTSYDIACKSSCKPLSSLCDAPRRRKLHRSEPSRRCDLHSLVMSSRARATGNSWPVPRPGHSADERSAAACRPAGPSAVRRRSRVSSSTACVMQPKCTKPHIRSSSIDTRSVMMSLYGDLRVARYVNVRH